ncbi:MAG: aldo/keto reductase [Acidobacteriaceae bacterium]|nr:aldo/keto reductase [Acidobacteriaceae bacterium]
MEKKQLGRSGLMVSPICLGGNVFGWTIDEQKSFTILDAFVDRGFNFIDTADVYSRWAPGNKGGESETILGNWFARTGKRDKVVLATKVGMEVAEGKGLRKAHIVKAVEQSLHRLQTSYIDLYQAHTDDAETPLEETLGAFASLVQAGKVRAIGASNYTGKRLAVALDIAKQNGFPRYESIQPHYNLVVRQEDEEGVEPVVDKHNIGVIPYFSLAAGFLTGKYKSKADAEGAARAGYVTKYFDERGERILKALAEVSASTGAKQATVALAWLLSRRTVTAPIASATSLEQLNEVLAAGELKLHRDDTVKLCKASAL